MEPPPAYSLLHGHVMTDEQMEILRRQISVYATICQQLVEMHKAFVAQQHSASGQPILYVPPPNSVVHKLPSRQRWTPSPIQLQVLEMMFQQSSGTPNKQNIKEITAELVQHGPISETNVYNWFQNRRARTKRKQQLGAPNTGESEVDTDADSPQIKKVKLERDSSYETSVIGQTNMNFQGLQGSTFVGQDNDVHEPEESKPLPQDATGTF